MGWICNSDELVAMKSRLNGPFNSLWDDVQACPGLSAQDKSAFNYEIESFHKWIKKGPISPVLAVALGLPGLLLGEGQCDASAGIREGRDFEQKLSDWRTKLAQSNCALSSPPLIPLDPNDPRSATYDANKKSPFETPLDKINGILKTTAIVGGIGLAIYGAWLATPILKELIAGRAALKKEIR